MALTMAMPPGLVVVTTSTAHVGAEVASGIERDGSGIARARLRQAEMKSGKIPNGPLNPPPGAHIIPARRVEYFLLPSTPSRKKITNEKRNVKALTDCV